jgi:hypothetical protein
MEEKDASRRMRAPRETTLAPAVTRFQRGVAPFGSPALPQWKESFEGRYRRVVRQEGAPDPGSPGRSKRWDGDRVAYPRSNFGRP